jgi:hypothetical protein
MADLTPEPEQPPEPTYIRGPAFRVRAVWIGVAVLLILHVAARRCPGTDLRFGWLPDELAFRIGWMLVSACLVVLITRVVWTIEDEEVE